EEVLGEILAPDEDVRALELVRGRVGRLSDLPSETAFARLSGFLARRGYAPDVARRAARPAPALESVTGCGLRPPARPPRRVTNANQPRGHRTATRRTPNGTTT